MNCKEIIIFLVLSYQPKKNSLSVCGTAALAVFEKTSQKYIHNATYKRQTEHLPCRLDKQAQERMERLTAR